MGEMCERCAILFCNADEISIVYEAMLLKNIGKSSFAHAATLYFTTSILYFLLFIPFHTFLNRSEYIRRNLLFIACRFVKRFSHARRATVLVAIDKRPCVNVRLSCAGEPIPVAVGELYGMVWEGVGSARGRPQAGRTSESRRER